MSKGLKVTINDAGTITIRISASSLKFAAQRCPRLETLDDATGDYLLPKINAKVFAKEVWRELVREQEDGTTPVHELFDKAFEDACEQGADGILMPTDSEYGRKLKASGF